MIPELGFDRIWDTISRFRIDNNLVNDLQSDSITGKFWKSVHQKLARELGRARLGRESWYGDACLKFLITKEYLDKSAPDPLDELVKAKISLIELVFQSFEQTMMSEISFLGNCIQRQKSKPLYVNKGPGIVENQRFLEDLTSEKDRKLKTKKDVVLELNQRFRKNSIGLHYHNGVIQIEKDSLIARQIEEPFWDLVSDLKWENVSHDMKVAIDYRDNGGEDPCLYAAMALESTIKIISGDKKWTTGKEKGAANYIDNLASSANGHFIQKWESEALKAIFQLRNPHGHGPGAEPQPSLTNEQISWIIESCMSWIKSLIRRL